MFKRCPPPYNPTFPPFVPTLPPDDEDFNLLPCVLKVAGAEQKLIINTGNRGFNFPLTTDDCEELYQVPDTDELCYLAFERGNDPDGPDAYSPITQENTGTILVNCSFDYANFECYLSLEENQNFFLEKEETTQQFAVQCI
jgi:hypothetical protein